MSKRQSYVTVHNPETGESQTFGPDDELPSWAEEIVKEGNPDAFASPAEEDQAPVPGPSQGEDDLIGDASGEDSLMRRNKDDLLALAEQEGAASVSDSNTKAEIASAIRATGYDGE
jgi:hypothetical protein